MQVINKMAGSGSNLIYMLMGTKNTDGICMLGLQNGMQMQWLDKYMSEWCIINITSKLWMDPERTTQLIEAPIRVQKHGGNDRCFE